MKIYLNLELQSMTLAVLMYRAILIEETFGMLNKKMNVLITHGLFKRQIRDV